MEVVSKLSLSVESFSLSLYNLFFSQSLYFYTIFLKQTHAAGRGGHHAAQHCHSVLPTPPQGVSGGS